MVAIPALALLLSAVGCSGEVVTTDEQATAPTRLAGERCWTSGAAPCAEGLACLPDPAFEEVVDVADASTRVLAKAAMARSALDAGAVDPATGDPGARPWICQPHS